MRAVSPTGADIICSLEKVYGTCGVFGFERTPEGKIAFEYDDVGTDIDWNSQEQVVRDGHAVFIDSNGAEWTEDQVILVEDDEVEDEAVSS